MTTDSRPTRLTHAAEDLPGVVRSFLHSADDEALWLTLPFATLLRAAEQFDREGSPDDGVMIDPTTGEPYVTDQTEHEMGDIDAHLQAEWRRVNEAIDAAEHDREDDEFIRDHGLEAFERMRRLEQEGR